MNKAIAIKHRNIGFEIKRGYHEEICRETLVLLV